MTQSHLILLLGFHLLIAHLAAGVSAAVVLNSLIYEHALNARPHVTSVILAVCLGCAIGVVLSNRSIRSVLQKLDAAR